MLLPLLTLIGLTACGGGGGGGGGDVTGSADVMLTTAAVNATASTELPAADLPVERSNALAANPPQNLATAAPDAGPDPATLAVTPTDGAPAPDEVIQAATSSAARERRTNSPVNTGRVFAAGDATSPTALLGFSAAMIDLSYIQTNVVATTGAIAPTTACTSAFVAPAALKRANAVTLPTTGGVFFTATELAAWKRRVVTGPFIQAGDFKPGSPGDWSRIRSNAQRFAAGTEKAWLASNDTTLRTTHGTLLRDTAFYQLITQDSATLALVRNRLLAEAANPLNDFTQLCLRELNGSVQDAAYAEASWLLRFIVSYDFVRNALGASDRLLIENYIRRNGYFFAAQLDSGLAMIFPDRLRGSYARKARDAASTGTAIWASARVDTNGDCKVDGRDSATALPAYNYARADGSLGPRTSWLSQWYNNRKAVNAATVAAAGVMLGDSDLILSSKRYVMEWLTFSVWADGSQGEYMRNGEYCIPQQGVIYSSANTQAGLMIGRLLSRQGDDSLFAFHTRDGLYGTAPQPADADKSLELAAGAQYRLITRQLAWYAVESQKPRQTPRDATHLGRTEVRYMATGNAADDYHELGLLLGAAQLPNLPLAKLVMRDSTVTSLRFPGSTGYSVATGFGSWAGSWTDVFNTLPAILLLQ